MKDKNYLSSEDEINVYSEKIKSKKNINSESKFYIRQEYCYMGVF